MLVRAVNYGAAGFQPTEGGSGGVAILVACAHADDGELWVHSRQKCSRAGGGATVVTYFEHGC